MRKYLISLQIVDNGKKITAIRDLRSATGMGLGDAKTFVETDFSKEGYFSGGGGDLIVSGDQVAELMALHSRDYASDVPDFTIRSIKPLATTALDISGLLMVY